MDTESYTKNFKNIKYQLSIDPSQNTDSFGSEIPLYIVAYDVEGKYRGSKALTNELMMCRTTDSDAANARGVGVEYYSECELSHDFLFNVHRETLVYEVFLKDGSDFIDVPVALKIPETGLNAGKSDEDFRDAKLLSFKRRFVLVDRVSGIEPDTTSTNDCKTFRTRQPTVVRYASSIKLFGLILDQGSQTILTRPYFVIEYKTIKLSETKVVASTSYGSYYFKDLSSFKTAWLIILIILLVIAAIVSFSRVWIWTMHYPTSAGDVIPDRTGKLIKTSFYVVIETFGIAMFIFLMIFTFYVYAFFKWAKTIYHILPSPEIYPQHYVAFYTIFGITCGLVILSNMIAIFRQSFMDIFFLDWVPLCDFRKRRGFSRREPKASVLFRACGGLFSWETSTTS